LKKATKIVFELEAGDCLYLPCGWFHEVCSFGDKGEMHLAMNYWYAPPTNSSPQSPYPDDYWKEVGWLPVNDVLESMRADKAI
jgi:hypothetical protein